MGSLSWRCSPNVYKVGGGEGGVGGHICLLPVCFRGQPSPFKLVSSLKGKYVLFGEQFFLFQNREEKLKNADGCFLSRKSAYFTSKH